MSRKSELNKILSDAKTEMDVIKTKEKIEHVTKYIGKCFRYSNSFSCPEDASDWWNIYIMVERVTEHGNLYGFEFETDKTGKIEIRPDTLIHEHVLKTKIDNDLFFSEWSDLLAKLSLI